MTEEGVCPRCEQGDVHQMRVIATGEHIQVCDECTATWPANSELAVPGFEHLSTFLETRGISRRSLAIEDLNPPPVRTQEQIILDIRAKKPRRELKQRIRDNGGDPSSLKWIDALEYDTILGRDESDTTATQTLLSVSSASDATSWQAVLPFTDVENALALAAHPATDDVFVSFDALGDYGAARCPLPNIGPNLIPFALAASNNVAVGSPDLSSWLTVDTAEPSRGAVLIARGNYWQLRQ